jgi:hypothetical protein
MFSRVELEHPAADSESVGNISVQCKTLDELLLEEGNPTLDYVSIDVEGNELAVLRGFDFTRHKPALVLLEDHMKHFQLHRYMRRRGYRLVKRTGVNNWYVPNAAGFSLTGWQEWLWLTKRLWIHTPLAIFREWSRKIRRKNKKAT